MSNTRKIIFSAIAVIVVWSLYSILRPKQSDLDYLLSLPSHIAELAEKKEAGEIRKFIAKDYADKEGRTQHDLSVLVTAYTIQEGEISVYTLDPEVEINTAQKPERAKLSFKAALARGPKAPKITDVLPELASVYSFSFELEKTNDGWLIKSGDWQRSRL